MPRRRYATQEFHSSAQNAPGLPQSRLRSISGRLITNNSNCPTARVGAYGHSFKTLDGRQIRWHQAAPRPPHQPAFKVAPPSLDSSHGRRRRLQAHLQGLITEFANQLEEFDPNSPAHAAALRFRQGIIPDLMIDTRSKNPSGDVAKTLEDCTLADMKALVPGAAHSESTSTAFSHSVEKRQKKIGLNYHAAARSLGAELGSQPGSPGPVESELNTCNLGEVLASSPARTRAVQRIPRHHRPDRLSTRR